MKGGWMRIGTAGVVAVLLLALMVFVLRRASPPSPELLCVYHTPSPVTSLDLERVSLDEVRVTLRNVGRAPCRMGGLIFTLGEKEVSEWAWGELSPGEERDFTLPCRYAQMRREVGSYSLTGRLRVLDREGRILLDENLVFTLPTLGMGDTLPKVEWTDSISFTPLSWSENRTVTYTRSHSYRGPEVCTVEADPGTKFVLLHFRYQNLSEGVQETPWISFGKMATEEGLLYPLTPYSEGARWVYLNPGESVEGFFTFQIPEEGRPLEASFQCLGALVRF
jgi:hypothetical protein